MYKKLLRTYPLLGLILCTLDSPGQAGKYEEAFLDEVINNQGWRFACVQGPDKGSKDTWTTEKQKVLVGESKTPYGYNSAGTPSTRYVTTDHYAWQDVQVYHQTQPAYDCIQCRNDLLPGEIKLPKFILTRSSHKITITLPNDINGYTLPCTLLPRVPYQREQEDLLGFLCTHPKLDIFTCGDGIIFWKLCGKMQFNSIIWKKKGLCWNEL